MTKPEKKTTAGVKANETPAADAPPALPAGACVVNTKNCVGRAVNGKVCSYHAMQYDAAGRRRK